MRRWHGWRRWFEGQKNRLENYWFDSGLWKVRDRILNNLVVRKILWDVFQFNEDRGGADPEMIFVCGLCGRIVDGWAEGGTDDEWCDECWVKANGDLQVTPKQEAADGSQALGSDSFVPPFRPHQPWWNR